MSIPRYEVFRRTDDRWGFRLVAGNHETVGPSQGYATKAGALRGVEAHRRNAAIAVVRVLER